MAKTNMVEREKRRAKIVKKYAAKRAQLKELIRSPQDSRRRARGGAGAICRRCRAMRARRASAIAARSRAARVACTASSGCRA